MGSSSKSATSSSTNDNRVVTGDGTPIFATGAGMVDATTPEAWELGASSLDFADSTLNEGLSFGKDVLSLAANALDSVNTSASNAQNAALKSLDFADNFSRSDSTTITQDVIKYGIPAVLLATVAWRVLK